jgi:hypothetical protein
VVGTLRFPARDAELFTARKGTLFGVVMPQDRSDRVTVFRKDTDGRLAERSARFPLEPFLCGVATGPRGVYAGTCVIRRFTGARDQLILLDPRTLTIRARAYFPGMVSLVVEGSRLWAAIGDGELVRLNPRTLAVEARRQVVRRRPGMGQEALVFSPSIGLGSLWVLTGDKRGLELLRLDPVNLALRSRTRLPRGLARTTEGVVADPQHVYLTGTAIASVDTRGRVGKPFPEPDLGAAVAYGSGLVGVTYPPAVVLLDAHGRVRARSPLLDTGLPLALDGRDLWLEGDADQGNGLVHIRLISARPSS